MTILVFFIILSILVLIHEFGHFWVAKKSGMIVEEFGFGLPPRLFGFKWRGTLYSLNALPFGGFVKIFGENPSEVSSVQKHAHRAFYQKSALARGGVIVAGPVMNFILAVAIISYMFTKGVYIPSGQVRIVEVSKNSPAHSAGLKKGDIFVRFDSEKDIVASSQLVEFSKKYAGSAVSLVFRRGKAEQKTSIIPREKPPKGQGSLGVLISDVKFAKYTWYQSPFVGLQESLRVSWEFYKELGKVAGRLITLQNPQVEVAGPVGIAQLTGKAVKNGFESVLQLMGLLSLNLALINLLPFPALDGGQLAFVVYEGVTRHKLKDELKARINAVGFACLLFLIILITFSDLVKLFK